MTRSEVGPRILAFEAHVARTSSSSPSGVPTPAAISPAIRAIAASWSATVVLPVRANELDEDDAVSVVHANNPSMKARTVHSIAPPFHRRSTSVSSGRNRPMPVRMGADSSIFAGDSTSLRPAPPRFWHFAKTITVRAGAARSRETIHCTQLIVPVDCSQRPTKAEGNRPSDDDQRKKEKATDDE